MKRYQSTVLILLVSLFFCAPHVQAQKQGRVEKLLKYLWENDMDKFQKNREKLDPKTAEAFPNEVALIDVMDKIWNKNEVKSTVDYYEYYAKSMQGVLLSICANEKIAVDYLRDKTDKQIIAFLETSEDKLEYSQLLIDNVRKTEYPVRESDMKLFLDTREEALVASSKKDPQIKTCLFYFLEYPKGKYEHQMRMAHNALLFQAVKNAPAKENFNTFFGEGSLNDFFGALDNRMHIGEVRTLYADYIFKLIQESSDPAVTKEHITEYKTSGYLKDQDRKHLEQIEYINDKVDYHILKESIKGASDLHLIGEYLKTHKYKEFKDSANLLRTSFEEQTIWSNPSSMKFYEKNVLMRSNEVDVNKTTTTTYNYMEGKLGNIVSVVEEKGKSSTLQTSLYYDIHDRCALEVQIDPKTKKEVFKRTRTFTPNAEVIDSTLYADKQMILRRYDKAGNMLTELEFNAKGEKVGSVANKYNDKGVLIESEQHFPISTANLLPNTIIAQKNIYEYDKYGYLSKITFERTLGNSDKSTGSLTVLYDEYGNQIDSSAFYEYDVTGRWVRKIDRNNPDNVERIQVVYK